MTNTVPRALTLAAVPAELPHWNQADADSFAAFADQVFAPLYPYLIEDIQGVLQAPLKGRRVLEIGGGVGNMALEFLRVGVASIDGVDVSAAMLEKTRERLRKFPDLFSRFTGHQSDAAQLPFADGAFDLVFSRGSIQFWPDIPAALREIRRVLTPGGLAYVGGGFGLSTPAALKQKIKAQREEHMVGRKDLKPIPQLNHADVLAVARKLGGRAELVIDAPGAALATSPGTSPGTSPSASPGTSLATSPATPADNYGPVLPIGCGFWLQWFAHASEIG